MRMSCLMFPSATCNVRRFWVEPLVAVVPEFGWVLEGAASCMPGDWCAALFVHVLAPAVQRSAADRLSGRVHTGTALTGHPCGWSG